MSEEKRSRIVRIKDIIIITNYKCMFSSINKLNICELDPKYNIKYKKIFLYRNPIDRAISCFLNWMIKVPKNKEVLSYATPNFLHDKQVGWLLPILCKETSFNFNYYKYLLIKDDILELFKMYISMLENIKDKNEHMHNQIRILKKKKFKIDIFLNIDNKEDILFLENIIQQKTICENNSRDTQKQILKQFINNNSNFRNKLYEYYKDDFDFFKKSNLL